MEARPHNVLKPFHYPAKTVIKPGRVDGLVALKAHAAKNLKAATYGMEVELPNAYAPVIEHLGNRLARSPRQLYSTTFVALVKQLEEAGHDMPAAWLMELSERLLKAAYIVCDGPTGWREEIPYFTDILTRADEVMVEKGNKGPASTYFDDLDRWWARWAYGSNAEEAAASRGHTRL